MLDTQLQQIAKEENDLELDRYPKLFDKVVDYVSGEIEEWSIPMFLIYHGEIASGGGGDGAIDAKEEGDVDQNPFRSFLTVEDNVLNEIDIRYFLCDYDENEEDAQHALMLPLLGNYNDDDDDEGVLTIHLDLEDFLNDFLHQVYVDNVYRKLEAHVSSRIVGRLKTERAIFISEKQVHPETGAECSILIVGMYTEEYSWDAAQSERGRAYIKYLAKSGLQRMKVYPSIPSILLVAYMRFIELIGLSQCHLWVDPPNDEDDFIFRGQYQNMTGGKVLDKNQRENSVKHLRKWYTKTFDSHGWDRQPYEWNPGLILPPSFGNEYDEDIKRYNAVSASIISSLKGVVSRLEKAKRELNSLFKQCTLVVSLDTPMITHRSTGGPITVKDISAICRWPNELEAHVIVELESLDFSVDAPFETHARSSEKIIDLLYRNQRSTQFMMIEYKTNPKGRIIKARAGHTASLWRVSNYIVFGGITDNDECSNEVLDLNLKTNTWVNLSKRYRFNAGAIVGSGYDTDETNNVFEQPKGRYGHVAVVYKDSLFVFGGMDDQGNALRDMWEFNLRERCWRQVVPHADSEIPEATAFSSVAMIKGANDHKMILFGGISWYSIAATEDLSDEHDLTRSIGSHDLYEFDFRTSKWTLIEHLNRRYDSSSDSDSDIDSDISRDGEEEEHQYVDEVEDEDEEAHVPTDRFGQSMVEYDNKLWIFGGGIGELGFHSNLYCFDLSTRKWRLMEPLGTEPSPRKFHAAVVIGRNMYIYGGESSNGLCNDLFEYNFENNMFTYVELEGSFIPRGASMMSNVSYKSQLVIFGGIKKHIKLSKKSSAGGKENTVARYEKASQLITCSLTAGQLTSGATVGSTTTISTPMTNTKMTSHAHAIHSDHHALTKLNV